VQYASFLASHFHSYPQLFQLKYSGCWEGTPYDYDTTIAEKEIKTLSDVNMNK
jgi:hypothetical protein